MRRGFVLGPSLLALGAIGAGTQIDRLTPIVNPAIRPVGLEAQDSHAAASLVGQFRTSVSASMFLRADLYLHNGVEMRPLSDAERRDGRTGMDTSEPKEEQLHDESGIVTVVPERERDFRGVLGDVERAVSAYKDMHGHRHNDPEATLPLFRLMTELDPQFVPGWTNGAMILARDRTPAGMNRALAFLKQGNANNPESPEILGAIGKLYLTHTGQTDASGHEIRDLAAARPWYHRANRIAEANASHLTEPEQEAALENARFAAMLERDAGDRAAFADALRRGLRLFPEDRILLGLAEKAGILRTP